VAKRILIIDDDLDFGSITKLTLESTGAYKARAVSMARQSVTVARDFQPDLILLDCMMPGWDGGQVAANLEKDPVTRNIPVIFLTATVSAKEVRTDPGGSGPRTYLPKFIRLEELTSAIDETIAAAQPDSGDAATDGTASDGKPGRP
jgi:two-component system OmpR family response regulator